MTDREKLMREMQISSFGLFDVALYLDTHPTDRDALAYYNKHNQRAKELKEQYTAQYGPLNISDHKNESSWKWAEAPWPWEYQSDSNGK